MHTFGQLIHVEDLYLGIVHYRIAVFRVKGGLHGAWSCDTCLAQQKADAPDHPTVEECVADTKKAIDQHHRENHAGLALQS